MNLTLKQKRLLETLIHIHCIKRKSVSAEEIACELHMQPGSVRNTITNLIVLGLVESVPGPGGGYTPTEDGYAAVKMRQGAKTASILKECSVVSDVGADNATINFSTNEVKVKLAGKLKNINTGDALTIVSKKFEIMGTVLSKNEDLHQVVMDGKIITRKG